jgi:hypothetical protein
MFDEARFFACVDAHTESALELRGSDIIVIMMSELAFIYLSKITSHD